MTELCSSVMDGTVILASICCLNILYPGDAPEVEVVSLSMNTGSFAKASNARVQDLAAFGVFRAYRCNCYLTLDLDFVCIYLPFAGGTL